MFMPGSGSTAIPLLSRRRLSVTAGGRPKRSLSSTSRRPAIRAKKSPKNRTSKPRIDDRRLSALGLLPQLPVDRLAGIPVTRNVAWDGRLESFKGSDTTQYVSTAAAIATTCGACRRLLQPGEPLSLSVDITKCTAPDGTEYVTFSDSGGTARRYRRPCRPVPQGKA
jgi:hypothetical protein